jgi:hypothetical protein
MEEKQTDHVADTADLERRFIAFQAQTEERKQVTNAACHFRRGQCARCGGVLIDSRCASSASRCCRWR